MAVDPQIKILLVEDAGTMRKMEAKILQQLGFKNIVEAADGNEAMEKLRFEADIRLVISDWAMPNLDGYGFVQQMRADDRLRNIPFIMATGHGDKEYVAKAMEGGANGVVAKPFTPDELRVKIDEAFGVKKEPAPKAEEQPRVTKEGALRLKVAHIQITDHLALGVLKHQIALGREQPNYFNLETMCMPSWNPVQKALEDGSVDAAFILAPAAMDLFSYDVPIRLILFAHRNGSILVRNKTGKYQKPFQQFFKHKTFFIPHKMSVHNMLAHMYFSQMGLKPGLAGKEAVNVLFDVVPPIQMPAFLAENPNACGFMVAEPIGSRAIAAGIAERQFLSSEIWQNHPCCVVVFRQEIIGKYPDAVHEFTNLLVKAGQFIVKQPDQAAEIAVSFLDPDQKLGLEIPLLKSVLTDPLGIKTDDLFPVIEDLETIQGYMTSKMEIGRLIDLEKFVDTRFAKVACSADTAPAARIGAVQEVRGKEAGVKQTGPKMGAAKLVTIDAEQDLATRAGKYLIFSLGSERYGLGILDVREIIKLLPIVPLLKMPGFVDGIINLRGRLIPIVDTRTKFGMTPMERNDRTCIIVVEISGVTGSILVGLVVDTVCEVVSFREEETENAPCFSKGLDTKHILGMAKQAGKVTILLDIDRIFHRQEIMQISGGKIDEAPGR